MFIPACEGCHQAYWVNKSWFVCFNNRKFPIILALTKVNSPLAIFSVHRPGNSLLRNELEVGQCIPEARKAVRKNLASLERTGKLGGWDYKQHCFHTHQCRKGWCFNLQSYTRIHSIGEQMRRILLHLASMQSTWSPPACLVFTIDSSCKLW